MKKPEDIDGYISEFPEGIRIMLNQVRETIKKAATGADEVISYGIPAFKLNGKAVVFFAAFKKHIGIYPAPRGIEEFKEELSKYNGGKGTVQFPFDKPIPLKLITGIVKFILKNNLQMTKDKKKKQI